jgi:hypothetical protein
VVTLVGYTLPARHRATRTLVVPAPASQVFALISDVGALPSWRPSVARVEVLPESAGGRGRRFREVGRNGTILYAIDESIPDRRLVTRIADPSLPFGGSWTFELEPSGDATLLRITEDGEVRNPIFRFVSRFVMGHHATIDAYLRDVGDRLGSAPPAAAAR